MLEDLKPGTKIEKYEILSRIGSGGMGVVYKAKQISLDRIVALKVLPPPFSRDEEMARRFIREARAMAKINHPNVVMIHDVGKGEDFFYFTMEYLPKSLAIVIGDEERSETPDGTVLIHRSKKETKVLSIEEGLRIVKDICNGLSAIHEAGIIHRDIKPQNILLTDKGRVKIADFGIVKQMGDATLTQTHTQLGTMEYIAPEQKYDAKNVDQRADIYSLGVLMYRMWTGRLPVGLIKPPSFYNKGLTEHLDSCVSRCLEPEPEDRFSDAMELLGSMTAPVKLKDTPAIITGSKTDTQKIITLKGMEFVLVPEGEFEMGDVFGDGSSEEKPVHTVSLDSFYLGKYPVTFDQYDAFCEATGKKKPGDEGWGRGRRPVIYVIWEDAVAFCEWMSDETGEKIRLPTEAEWEYAARECGKKVRFGNGKDIADPKEINFDGRKEYKKSYSVVGEYRKKTTPVGSFKPNALGLYDMTGNVWEWCTDWYDDNYYQSSPSRNPQGPSSGKRRVLRGGSWDLNPRNIRCMFRYRGAPDGWSFGHGFRCARTP